MSIKATATKKAQFFRLYLLRNGSRAEPMERDWQDFLAKVKKRPLTDREHDGFVFDPVEIEGRWALAIHKPVNKNYMSHIDEASGTIQDILDSPETKGGLAHSTAVFFPGIENVFVLALGGGSSPHGNAVEAFMECFAPPGQGAAWRYEPLMAADQIQALKDSRGISMFSTRFSTKRSLFDRDAAPKGIVTYGEQIADRLGGDVEVEITVSLAPEARGIEHQRKFLGLVIPDLLRLTTNGARARARAKSERGDETDLRLVAHRLAAEFEISALGANSAQFSELVRALIVVSGDAEDKVKEILRG